MFCFSGTSHGANFQNYNFSFAITSFQQTVGVHFLATPFVFGATITNKLSLIFLLPLSNATKISCHLLQKLTSYFFSRDCSLSIKFSITFIFSKTSHLASTFFMLLKCKVSSFSSLSFFFERNELFMFSIPFHSMISFPLTLCLFFHSLLRCNNSLKHQICILFNARILSLFLIFLL